MILETALLQIRPGQETEFEQAFEAASPFIASSDGYLGHSLSRCIERSATYLLLVRWRSLEDHLQGFRSSPQFQEWRRLLHHFYEPPPTVEHFAAVLGQF
jgi:heme-degrading monooxygenase HmoA